MSASLNPSDPNELIEIPLKDPLWAAALAWLWPGGGHLYQGRVGKGILFMVCILGTFFFGLTLGRGRVVYASWTENDRRYPYLLQVGVGLPALPALVQNYRVRHNGGNRPGRLGEPLRLFGQAYMAPPEERFGRSELAEWHEEFPSAFELGTLYTMVAGLLNVLAIYDAFAGPVLLRPDERSDKPPPEDEPQGDEPDK